MVSVTVQAIRSESGLATEKHQEREIEKRECANGIDAEDACGCWIVSAAAGSRVVGKEKLWLCNWT